MEKKTGKITIPKDRMSLGDDYGLWHFTMEAYDMVPVFFFRAGHQLRQPLARVKNKNWNHRKSPYKISEVSNHTIYSLSMIMRLINISCKE